MIAYSSKKTHTYFIRNKICNIISYRDICVHLREHNQKPYPLNTFQGHAAATRRGATNFHGLGIVGTQNFVADTKTN
jgi:hypothetical protein